MPASTANLGPGFDTLGLALNRYVEVTIEPADTLSLRVEGAGSEAGVVAGLAKDERHLAVRVAKKIAGHDRLSITVSSDIPVARGLGSSAALAAAAAAAAGSADPLGIAAAIDGHAENAAASVLGGFVTATVIEGQPVAHRLPLDPELSFVVIIPSRELATTAARAALPARLDFADAVHNLGRMGQMIAGLADHRRLVAASAGDRLHQDYRMPLFAEAPDLLRAMLDAGALASCWSGAGPSLLGICHRDGADAVRRDAEQAMTALGVRGEAVRLEADTQGIVTSPRRPK